MIRFGLPFAAYRDLPGAHFSTLKHLDVSALAYRHACDHERADTPALRLGRAVHSLILTPDAVDVAVWDGGDRRGKAWKDFEAANAGRTIVKCDEIATAERMRAAVLAHPAAAHLLSDGDAEVSITWTSAEGIPLKCRVDWLRPNGAAIVELKTTRHIHRFESEAARFLYHAQAAIYQDGLLAALATAPDSLPHFPVPVYIIAVENVPPHDVRVLCVPDEVLEVGRRKVDGWLATVAECERTGRWPGVDGGAEAVLTLPEWAAADGIGDVDTSGVEEDGDGNE